MFIYEFSKENRGDLCGWGFVLLCSYRDKGGLKMTKFSEASCLSWLVLPRHVQHLNSMCKLESGNSSAINAHFDHRQCSKQQRKQSTFWKYYRVEDCGVMAAATSLLTHTRGPLVCSLLYCIFLLPVFLHQVLVSANSYPLQISLPAPHPPPSPEGDPPPLGCEPFVDKIRS